MSQTTFADGRGIVHEQSGGMSIVFPDVCLTPMGTSQVPIPYPNIGRSADTTAGPTSVVVDGSMPMTRGARYATSSGDEAGVGGGVASGRNRGTCEFTSYSFTVKFEGRNVCRLGDSLVQNDRNAMG